MTRDSTPWWTLLAMAVVLIVAGLVQMVYPAFVLEQFGAVVSPTTRYAFGIIGMFIAVLGGILLHTMRSSTSQPVAALWVAVAMFGLGLAGALGVYKGYFATAVLGAVAFDLFTSLLVIWYWRTIKWPTA